jgi:hypothetical protein
MADFSHQSFGDIVSYLHDKQITVSDFINQIESNIEKVVRSGYWQSKVSVDFIYIIVESINSFKKIQEELIEIAEEIQIEVREHHCRMLKRISQVADEFNVDIGQVWHRNYIRKEYGVPDFRIVEDVYEDTRDLAINLSGIFSIEIRLRDFIGKTKVTMDKGQNLGGISQTTFGDNATIIVGNHNVVKHILVKKGDFNDLRELLIRNNLSEVDIEELKEILETDQPDYQNKVLGSKAISWISKMVGKSLEGTWAIGIGAAGQLLADGIKAFYGFNI